MCADMGRHFPGAKRPDGSWVPAAYKADYVNFYQLWYRRHGSEVWELLHGATGLPTQEDDTQVEVIRMPQGAEFDQGRVTTVLDVRELELQDVAEIRLEAKGAHWIGVYEVEVLGRPKGNTLQNVQK